MLKKIIKTPLAQIVLLTILVLIGMVTPLNPWTSVENINYDFWVQRFDHPENQPIAIVAIDEASVQAFGDWPWSRARIAELIGQLSANGASAIGLCMLYTQPDAAPGVQAIQDIRTRIGDPQWEGHKTTTRRLDQMLGRAQAGLNQDADLVRAIRRGRNMVLPLHIAMQPPAEGESPAPSGLVIVNSLDASVLPAGDDSAHSKLARAVGAVDNGPLAGDHVLEPFDAMARKAGALGYLNLDEDADGRVRRVPLLMECKERLIASFAFQVAIKQMGSRLKDVAVNLDMTGRPHLGVGGLELATDGAYRMLLNYDSQWTRQRVYAYGDIANGTIDPAVFRGRIVLIGITAQPFARSFQVAGGHRATDVEISANVLAGILNEKRLSRPTWTGMLEVGVLLYFATFLALVLPRVSLRIGAIILLIFLATWYLAAVGLLVGYGFKVEVMGPISLAVGGFLLLCVAMSLRKMQQEKVNACKTLGLSYQGQGLLDLAQENYMKCPVGDSTVKNLLYNLGQDFERKRMFNKALEIYRHIRSVGNYKDVDKRIERYSELSQTVISGGKRDNPLLIATGGTKPTFGRYEIIKEIGRGGMGTVYLGRDPKINREVAIKTLEYAAVEPAELPEVKTRFFREAEAAGNLSHPNIVSIFDVGEEHDMAYIAMELLKGDNLTWHCVKDQLQPVFRVLEIMADVAAALDYAHTQGVIHRDVKPANIMMLEDGRVKVTDFSIAHVVDASQTRTGVVLGTPNYMSPEQVAGKKLDGRSDLFSLGIVLYEMLSGTKPFKGDSMSAILYAITHNKHTPIAKVVEGIPHCVKTLVNKLLAKQKSKRFDSAASVCKAIDDCLNRI